jgi:hypothetical protein
MNWIQTHGKLIGILAIVVILGIIGGIILSVRSLPPDPGKPQVADNQTMLASCTVEEYNLSYGHWMNIIPLTDAELTAFPEVQDALHGADRSPSKEIATFKVVKSFSVDMSKYYRFVQVVCTNKTLIECFPQPPIYEYHGRYYTVSCDPLHGHTTYVPSSNTTT